MKSCKNTSVQLRLTDVKVILLIFVSLLCVAMTYPAYAMSNSPEKIPPQTQMKENRTDNLPTSVLKAVQEDLAKQTNLSTDEFKLSKATRQTWSDGCLGLGKAEELCTQALVEGWRVTVARGKQTWVYRTDGTGRVVRQEE